ncbi:NADP-dependent oxidoreductase [Tomitella cavernea]|uniref:NADP-dependent oxidoreductase n=1 Tax=Tomitella cavernea TaxID=1387982 RepID=A0ABP9CPK9_9ACTN
MRTSHISIDPAMRRWLNDVRSYVPPVGIGEVMRAHAVGEVTASRHPDFPVGTHVFGDFGVAEYAESDGEGVTVIDPALAPAPVWLGALGLPGMTAYFGLTDVGGLRPGDTLVISGAAGAVGSIAGQIGKLMGCRVIGIAGGPDKCAWLTDELGFDAAIDYKRGSIDAALRTAAPDGVDVYFDNVGGDILDSVLGQINVFARVVLCGAISQYNAESPSPGPSRYLSLLVRRAKMQGLIIFDYTDRYPEAVAALSNWLRRGGLIARTHLADGGIEDFGDTLNLLFDGANTGKLVLQLTHNPTDKDVS